VRLEGELDTLHIYLRHEMMCEVAADLGLYHDRVDLEPYLGEPDLLLEQLALGVSGALTDGDPAPRSTPTISRGCLPRVCCAASPPNAAVPLRCPAD
jgi:hypothetical protein